MMFTFITDNRMAVILWRSGAPFFYLTLPQHEFLVPERGPGLISHWDGAR